MAQDSKGSSTPYASFTLTVNAGDVQPNPPEPPPPPLAISAPADMTATATTPCGQTTCAQVYYSFTVTGGTPPYTLVCNLPSGGLFTVGAHTISCLAQDSKGNSTPNASFTLTVAAQAGGGGSSGGPYTPDVTGCTSSTCMANSLSFFELDGCPCDFGSFNWNRTSYALASQLPAGAIKPPLTIHTGNQTNDVAVSFTANGRPVAVASSAATGQQSGIAYTSGPIDLVSGTNVLTVSVDDPLHRLPATVYTWSFDYAAPPAPPSTTTTTNTSGTGTGSSGSTTTTGAPTGPEPANPTQPAPAVLAAIAVSAPVTTSRDGRRVLSFAVRSPAAASLHVTVLSQTGHTLLRFTARARKGRTRIVRTLPRQVNGRTHLTLRVTIGAHGRTRTIRVHVRA
jgi:hypothetical protein